MTRGQAIFPSDNASAYPSAREKAPGGMSELGPLISFQPTWQTPVCGTKQGKITPAGKMTHNSAGQTPLSPCLVEWRDPA
jgi:hypothetical protein